MTEAAQESEAWPRRWERRIMPAPNYRRVVELIQQRRDRAGERGPRLGLSRLGPAERRRRRRRTTTCTDTSRVPMAKGVCTERPAEGQTPPSYLDWDLARPCAGAAVPRASISRGRRWYRWWDFGNGTMSDLGSHWNDLPFWALKLDAPKTIEAMGPDPHPEIAPASMTAVYEYGPRGDMPACKLTWYQGTHKPQIWTDKGIPQWPNGVLFIGTKGECCCPTTASTCCCRRRSSRTSSGPRRSFPNRPAISRNGSWRSRTARRPEARSTTMPACSPRRITWATSPSARARRSSGTAPGMRVTNTRAADPFLRREAREGWRLGGLA